MLAAGSCHAAAPVYFDLAGLIAYGGLYLLGFLTLIVLVSRSDRSTLWSLILLAYVATPVVFFWVSTSRQQARNEAIADETKLGEISNVEAFSAYCKNRKRVVNQRVPTGVNASLLLRQESKFTGLRAELNGSPLHHYMVKNRMACEKTGLRYLEAIYNGRYLEEKKGYEREVHRYSMCGAEEWSPKPQPESRYELVLGESSERKSVPWGGAAGRWMSSSSLRVVDKETGATLAEDTMYFLRYETGKGGCPDGLEQLASLIADVFPKE
jgi:hypothetical protein